MVHEISLTDFVDHGRATVREVSREAIWRQRRADAYEFKLATKPIFESRSVFDQVLPGEVERENVVQRQLARRHSKVDLARLVSVRRFDLNPTEATVAKDREVTICRCGHRAENVEPTPQQVGGDNEFGDCPGCHSGAAGSGVVVAPLPLLCGVCAGVGTVDRVAADSRSWYWATTGAARLVHNRQNNVSWEISKSIVNLGPLDCDCAACVGLEKPPTIAARVRESYEGQLELPWVG